ncbi:MAG: D-lactate dehydrogenase [Chroococcidiopsis cubana SAG 39.79]|jgi:D-lactate dehydrogenase|uniref:Lactate dehydrogenase n=1 Tax=Chroococcidiopsis cubana SAG 39.79 TaxID=388085 RepID=A0AB37UQC4_9CYAN|nr:MULTISPECIES: 2-hydroxyacid dehydrogenase [Chroococcidiopsis]MDZ4873766.1 D-lactate dehydrogenase [Chroococcidiopsis cubana SAG 39.79]PSB57739.1 hydroxyacid dehydrogenase [Chroococcidiopsis cubana CCALA 043]RUT13560.1 lactate dehydrogenase [Chroococcidiopsis cubana SAG 39.79]URD51386.1 2-hydroxyacid dehydrogenase [Chroococcidiopsis sp. CCNUC1]
MKVAVFSTKSYDRTFLETANAEYKHELAFFEPRLTCETSILAKDYPVVCVFVNDQLDRQTLTCLADRGTKLIALRAAGYNNIDIIAATELGLPVVRVPAYSPYAVAEYTLGIILALNRKIYRTHYRVREGNFSLEGLMGFDLHGKTAGIVGTGKIGAIVAQILHACGCHVLAYDKYQNPDCQALGVQYVSLQDLFARTDIISLHCPLTPETYHLVNSEAIALMKTGVMLINTSRGALIDAKAAIKGLKSGKIGYLGLDVYEQEGDIFFEDLSNTIVQDDVLQRLLTFPNVLITGHQAFFTKDALTSIAQTTLANISDFESGKPCPNQIKVEFPQAVATNVK